MWLIPQIIAWYVPNLYWTHKNFFFKKQVYMICLKWRYIISSPNVFSMASIGKTQFFNEIISFVSY